MPNLSGSNLVKKILAMSKKKFEKVIVMTDFWDELDIAEVYLENKIFTLNKPFSFDELKFYLENSTWKR